MKRIIRENFLESSLSPELIWFNKPKNWILGDGKLSIAPQKTDFWARTHYDFIVDNGHCLFFKTNEDFIITTSVSIFPKNQYDQAGLMVRINENFWLKTSVEYEDERLSRLGVVVTNYGFSDWSTQDVSSNIKDFIFKVEKAGMDYLVHYRSQTEEWSQLRIAHLHKIPDIVYAGLYACCPVDIGFRAEFHNLEITIK